VLGRVRELIFVVRVKQASVAGGQDIIAYRPEANGQQEINVFI